MKLIFIEKQKEADDAISFIFKPKTSKTRSDLVWKAGQYLFYTIPANNPDNRGVTRYFTISSAPFEKHITITTRIFEKPSTFKKSLMKLRIGDEIEASGPDGNFVVEDPKRNFIFIAGGIGITPFHSILLDLDNKNLRPNIQLLYANHDENIVFKEELESLKNKNPNLKITYFISPVHIDAQSIEKLITNNELTNNLQFFVSGPTNFVRVIRDIIKSQGVSKENIKTDSFPGYS